VRKEGAKVFKKQNRPEREQVPDRNELSKFEGGLYEFAPGNGICKWATLDSKCGKWAGGHCAMRHHIWHDGLNEVVHRFLAKKKGPDEGWDAAVKHVQDELKRVLGNNEHTREDRGAQARQQRDLAKPAAPPASQQTTTAPSAPKPGNPPEPFTVKTAESQGEQKRRAKEARQKQEAERAAKEATDKQKALEEQSQPRRGGK
jgi:hypothetical protein